MIGLAVGVASPMDQQSSVERDDSFDGINANDSRLIMKGVNKPSVMTKKDSKLERAGSVSLDSTNEQEGSLNKLNESMQNFI